MATLAIAGAGALGSSALGLGAGIGWLAGTLIGNLLFPAPSQEIVQQGPRLGDLTVSSSAFGAPIPIPYGTVRVAGNMIWSEGIKETKHSTSTSSGGGKGGGGGGVTQTSITYTYSCSFAMAFGQGEADDVLRIWADGKLLYDKTGTGQVASQEVRYRFYPGSETQLASSVIAADKGEDNTPAFRGLCYIVFEDLQLANFGNRIPNMTAEITFEKTPSCPELEFTFTSGEPAGYDIYSLMVDSQRGRAYISDSSGDDDHTGFRAFDWWSGQEILKVTAADALSAESIADGGLSWRLVGIDSNGDLYTTVGATNQRPLVKIDGNSLRETARFGSTGSGVSNTDDALVATKGVCELQVMNITGLERFLVVTSFFNDVAVLTEGMGHLDNFELDEATTGGGCMGDLGEAWVTGYNLNGTQVGLYKVTGEPGMTLFGGVAVGVDIEKIATITPASIGASGKILTTGPIYDESDGGVILFIHSDEAKAFVVKYVGDSQLWLTELPVGTQIYSPVPATDLRFGVYAFLAGSVSYLITTRDGEYTTETCWITGGGVGSQFFSALDNTITKLDSNGLRKHYIGRGSGNGITLSDIVDDICDIAGLESGDYNTAALTDEVRGYVIPRQTEARRAIEPLATAFLFDGVESDYVLKFVKRGGSSIDDLDEDDLVGTGDSGNPWEESRTQEVELPEQVNVNFMDVDADYEQGTQFAKRITNPRPTMYSKNEVTTELPIVFNGDEAIQLAETLLYNAWLERSRYAFALPWEFLKFDPTDIFTMTIDDTTYTVRITAVDVGVDFLMELEGLSEDAALYTSTLVADSNYGFESQQIVGLGPTRLFLLNIPLLRDYDDLGGARSRIYFAMGSYMPADNPWPGATLYQSSDLEMWDRLVQGPDDIAWGTVVSVLDEPDSLWRTDEDSEIKVYMAQGADALESITQLQLVNNTNAALVGDELVCFRDVAQNADGSYSLTGLLRGRRGTDVEAASHAVGEIFILLTTATVESFALALADVNTALYYKSPTHGTLFEEAAYESFIGTGEDLKPYAPVQLDANYDGDNIDITWVRRTRVAGELRDGSGTVPIGEDSESYEVDIYDSAGTTIVRTLTSNSPEVTYTAAQQYEDGWTGGTLKFTVYQISAAIGRGFGRTETVDMGATWPGSSTTTSQSTSSTTSGSTSSTTSTLSQSTSTTTTGSTTTTTSAVPEINYKGAGTDVQGQGLTEIDVSFYGLTAVGDLCLAFITHRDTLTYPPGWEPVMQKKTSTGQGAIDQWITVLRKTYESDDGSQAKFKQASALVMCGVIVTLEVTEDGVPFIADKARGTYSAGATNPGLHPAAGAQGTTSGQIVLAASSCVYSAILPGTTTWSPPSGMTLITTATQQANRMAVAYDDAPTGAPLSGNFSHGTSTHDGAEIALVVGVADSGDTGTSTSTTVSGALESTTTTTT